MVPIRKGYWSRRAPTPAQRFGEAEGPQVQAVGDHSGGQCTAGGDGVASALATVQVGGLAGAKQEPLSELLGCLLKEVAEPLLAGRTLAVGPRAHLPVSPAELVAFGVQSAQHGELEARV